MLWYAVVNKHDTSDMAAPGCFKGGNFTKLTNPKLDCYVMSYFVLVLKVYLHVAAFLYESEKFVFYLNDFV